MRGGKAFTGIQEFGVQEEYRKSLEIGADDHAAQIYAANPDLKDKLDQIQREVFHTA